MREVDLLVVFVILIHWEVDDPAEAENVFLDKVELFTNTQTRRTSQFVSCFLLAGREEDTVAILKACCLEKCLQVLSVKVFQDRVLANNVAALVLT